MTEFASHGLKGGVWRGRLTAETEPDRVVLLQAGEVMAEARLTPDGPGAWQVEIELPGETVSDGVQTLLLKTEPAPSSGRSEPAGQLLARLPLMAGRPLDEDLMAELASLRAEMDMLKRELRRFATAHRDAG